MIHTDLTFITNEGEQKLVDRFNKLIEGTEFLDVLVGYFFSSGFNLIYKSLGNCKKMRVLIGIGTDRPTYESIQEANEQAQKELPFSNAEVKDAYSEILSSEMERSEDKKEVEQGIKLFIEWLKSGKIEIKAYPSRNIHAKLYIMTFPENAIDRGRVITGSSNFSQSGFADNLEFNVELKNRADYEFAKAKFDQLWANAVDVSERFIQTINTKTWLKSDITPYELYLKFLYEYFKDELNETGEVFYKYIPEEFKRLEYQEQAVLNAKRILEEYGGVFISDVVGLGKTYMAAMLASQIDGRTLVIAPPVLLERNNPGSWPNVFSDFRVHAEFESIGKLDHIIKLGTEKYKNVIVDEAHRFRTENNITYEKIANICRGKRVILVTATPYNNSPKDILSQVKLFQSARKSSIPNLPDLEGFFNGLYEKQKEIDRKSEPAEYIRVAKSNAKEIRNKVLKYLMVRRTRSEIENYFGDDLKKQGLKFPAVRDPEPVFYQLNEKEDGIFNKTVALIASETSRFKYARYTPLLYLKEGLAQPEELSQRNMGKFMKILLIKRLESSFHAFRNTVGRFIRSYEMFLREYEKGKVFISKKHTNKIFEYLEEGDYDAIQTLLDDEKAEEYNASDFNEDFKAHLENDLNILQEIETLWKQVKRDPKLEEFAKRLSENKTLKKGKLIVFTESKETADYISENLEKSLPSQILTFTGATSETIREKVIENFDARARHKKDDYRILLTTEVLSEGVNLHRSNIVINYDIPWNPTRLMQRVGRVNRVDTAFDEIHTFNFFPTKQANDLIGLKEAAEAKISAFISLLGADAKLLTDGEVIESHELFNRLISKATITGEDETELSELKHLNAIKGIRDNDPDLFENIKRLPKKARTARKTKEGEDRLLTYFRKGKLHKFYLAENMEPKELDFIAAAELLEATPEIKPSKLPETFYDLLDLNKDAFQFATTEELPELKKKGGRDSSAKVLRMLRAIDKRQLTEEQECFLTRVIAELEQGNLPKQTAKKTLKDLEEELKRGINPLRLVAVLQSNIPESLLEGHYVETSARARVPREVILSEYLRGE